MTQTDRRLNESVYDYEDRLVQDRVGPDACMKRTSNGAPWAMPCTHKRGHVGECVFNDPFGTYPKGPKPADIIEFKPDQLPPDKAKWQRTITVRLPKFLHERLKEEAYKQRTSLNKLCISKLEKGED